jgi:hypothetical protein
MIYLRISENSLQAKAFIQLAQTMEFVEIIDNEIPNLETIKAIEAARKGKTTKHKNSKELFTKLNKKANV